MAELLSERGAKIVGFTSIEGYEFESSRAVQNGQFTGLILDQETQPRLSKERIANWVKDIKAQFS